MQTGGGWQDQGSLIGKGIKRVYSAPGITQQIRAEELKCSPAFLKELSSRLVLVSTGQRHFGRFIVTDVMNRYLSADAQTKDAMTKLSKLNDHMRKAVAAESISEFGICMNLHAKYLDLLSPLIYNNIIKEMEQKYSPFAYGCSICGAGGGGYLAVLLKEGISIAQLQNEPKTEVLPVEII